MAWTIYDKTGMKEKCVAHSLEYSGSWMGECFVTISIESPSPVDFEIGDFLTYRGERFEINYDPSVIKKAPKNSAGDAFKYDNVKLNSLSDELTRCDFLDYVKEDNNIHFSSLPKFSFYASSIQDLADRIQANLDRIYTGDKKWTVTVHPEYVSETNVNIEVNNIKVWDALGLANSKFKANFITKGRTITIGTVGIAADNVFMYGKGKGLYEIQRTADTDQQIITRLRAYGSTRNMPDRYYNKLSGSFTGNYLPDNMAVDNLMLPGFPETTLDPYIDSENISVLGIREGSVFFDGSDDSRPEIFPSMEGMTAEDLKNAGISVSSTGALDEAVSAEQIEDNGLPDEDGKIEKETFTITLKDIGFDINDYLTGETAVISMKDGMCGGREFEIVKAEKSASNTVLTCNRVYDESIKRFFPYSAYNIKPGDKFVLLNITMPDVYIKAASQRLLTEAKKHLDKHDYVRYSYTPEVDDIYMARQHDEATASRTISIHDTIKEGDIFLFTDEDLGIDGSITIDSLTIKEGEKMIPQYKIVLREEKVVGTLQRMQNQIDSIVGGQGSGGYNAQQIQSLIRAFGSLIFLNKDREDQTNFLLKLLGGIITNNIESEGFTTGALGTGFTLKSDENGRSYLEVDYALFRRSATFVELLIQALRHVGGQIMLTPASMHCIRVEEQTDSYRCFFESTDGDRTIANEFIVGDQARSQTFNIKEGVHENVKNTYYWRLVTAVGEDYIDLSKTDCDAGSGVPSEGDDIVQLGNRTDAERQSAIILSSYGNDAPYFKLYRGINSYDLTGKEFVSFSRSEVMVIADSIRLSTGETVKDYIDGELGSLQIGGRNLIPDSKELEITAGPNSYSAFQTYILTENIKPDTDYVFSVDRSEVTDGREDTQFSVRLYRFTPTEAGYASALVDVSKERKSAVLHTPDTFEEGEAIRLLVYSGPHGDCQGRTMKWTHLKLEEGTVATAWTPAPEDLENSIVKVSEKVDTNFEVTQGLIKSEINSVKVMGTGSENIVKEGNYGIEGDAGNPGFIELYKSLVKGNTYTAVLSGELAEGYKFQLCDSGQWEIQGEFENVGGRIYLLRFDYDPQSTTLEHNTLYLRVEPEGGYTWDLDWVCIYEGNVIPPYVFIPAPQEQESGSLDIGVRNLLLNSKLDNLDGWGVNYAAEIVVFDGYTCLKATGSYCGIYTSPTTGNARLIPTEGKITNSIDVYVTAECNIVLGREGITNSIHVSEVNKWVRVHNTQTLDGTKGSYVIYVTGNTATAYFKDAKCETGTVPTGWTPAPEDLKGFEGQNLVVRGRYGITDSTSYWIRDVYLSKDLTEGKTYTAVLSGDVGGSQRFGLWDSRAIASQGLFTKKSGRIYTLTFEYKKDANTSNKCYLTLHNYPQSGVAANPADVDWLCIYEGAVDAPDVFVPAPEDDAELVAWGGHYGADKNDIYLNGVQAETETGRALHLHKLDLTRMKITMVGKYDVYATTGDAKTQFVTALNGITGDNLAIVTSRDAITIDTNMQAALRDFGADAPLMTQARMSFVFVGKKGIGAGNGVMKTSAVSAASVTVRIIEGVCMDFFSGGGLAEWKEETTAGIQNLKEKVTLYAQKVTTVEGTVTTMRSELNVLPGQISSKVSSTDFNGNNIVSRINQTATTITIDASKINLVGKVTIGMLDKTILENGKIKTELINADALVAKNIEATKGSIGGFNIGTDYIGASNDASSPYYNAYALRITSNFLRVGTSASCAYIGSGTLYSGSGVAACSGRFEVNSSVYLTENIGIYIKVEGATHGDNVLNSGNAALHIEKGAIYGFRPRLRRIAGTMTLSHMDTTIILTERCTVNLPTSNLQDGQMLFIRCHYDGQAFVYGRMSILGYPTSTYTTLTLNGGDMALLVYDQLNNIWIANSLGHW